MRNGLAKNSVLTFAQEAIVVEHASIYLIASSEKKCKINKEMPIDRLYFVLQGSFRRCLSRFYVGKSHVTITLQGHFFA